MPSSMNSNPPTRPDQQLEFRSGQLWLDEANNYVWIIGAAPSSGLYPQWNGMCLEDKTVYVYNCFGFRMNWPVASKTKLSKVAGSVTIPTLLNLEPDMHAGAAHSAYVRSRLELVVGSALTPHVERTLAMPSPFPDPESGSSPKARGKAKGKSKASIGPEHLIKNLEVGQYIRYDNANRSSSWARVTALRTPTACNPYSIYAVDADGYTLSWDPYGQYNANTKPDSLHTYKAILMVLRPGQLPPIRADHGNWIRKVPAPGVPRVFTESELTATEIAWKISK